MDRFLLVCGMTTALTAPLAAAPTPRNVPVAIACSGPIAVAARKALGLPERGYDDGLGFGRNPRACFGRMQIYDGAQVEYVAVAPSTACPGGKALAVYGRSRAGGYYAFFEKPVCGSTLSIGPKNRWGDWMLTIDGARYESRGAYYVPAR